MAASAYRKLAHHNMSCALSHIDNTSVPGVDAAIGRRRRSPLSFLPHMRLLQNTQHQLLERQTGLTRRHRHQAVIGHAG